MSLRNNVIIAGVITLFLGIIGSLLNEVFSPLTEHLRDEISSVPPANNITAKIFDNEIKEVSKKIENNSIISSNAVTFWFEVNKRVVNNDAFFLFWPYSIEKLLAGILPRNELYQYECSFDGQPFEDCTSPKPYGDLPTEVVHNFQVRTKGLLGNTQDVATQFKFTSLTSSIVKGNIVNNGTPIANAIITIDNINNITDDEGSYLLRNIKQGDRIVQINATIDNIPHKYKEIIFIDRGSEWKEKTFDINKINTVKIKSVDALTRESGGIEQTVQKNTVDNLFDQLKQNSTEQNSMSNATSIQPDKEDIKIEVHSQNISKNEKYLFKTEIWINSSPNILETIKKVSYKLHPTFKPNIINSTNNDNKFSINFNNWGIFTINAKVFFKNNTVKDLQLPVTKWYQILIKEGEINIGKK